MSLKEKMTALADAVREKAELTDSLTIDEMTEAVNGLVVNGVDVDERTLTVTPSKSQQNFTSSELGENAYYSSVTVNAIPDEYITTTDATADASNILEGKTAYVNGGKVTGAMINHGTERIDVKSGTSVVSIEAPGFYSGIVVNIERPNITSLEITPSKKTQRFFANDGNVENGAEFFDTVTVKAIPDEYITTTDATAVSGDILEGKTAYVNGEKVTGILQSVTATLSGNVVTIPQGVIAEEQTLTVPEAQAPTLSENTVTVHPGYVRETQTVTVGTAKEAETFTPGTAAITIPADSYLTGAQVIRGDSALIPENIKTGVSIFTVEGTFTSDADATASDIAKGKTAYVKGEKITGTASGGAVSPMWEYWEWKISTNRPQCNTYNVPSRGDGNAHFGILDGNLINFNPNPPKKYDETINWTYVFSRGSSEYKAIGDGKLYNVDYYGGITPLLPSLSGITQAVWPGWGILCCTGSGELYGGDESTKVRRVEYTREKDTDPIVYVNVSKILNCPQDYLNFRVITADGSLASVWLDKESFEYGDGAAYAEIETPANGNPFVNYYPQDVDDYGGDSTKTYELAFRTDGLWYRQAGTYYDETDRKTKRYSWNKANDPGLRKYDWLGYCSMIGNASYEGYDEETGKDIYKYTLKEYAVALHIDEQGRLWKIAPQGEIISTEYETVNFNLTGFTITQVGEDTDWQCVAPVAVNGVGTPGSFNGVWGQKGGKVVNLMASSSDIVEITWEEYPVPISGKMICVEGNKMYFAPEGVTVDLTKAGGTY